jgi:hypothetical protein
MSYLLDSLFARLRLTPMKKKVSWYYPRLPVVHTCYGCGVSWPCEGYDLGKMCECDRGNDLRYPSSYHKSQLDYFCSPECHDASEERLDAHEMVVGPSDRDPKTLLP